MNYKLVKIFVDSNVIKEETELKLQYNGIGIDSKIIKSIDYYYIEDIKDLGYTFSFKVRNIINGKTSYNTSDNILGIDGMTIERFAAAFDLDEIGNIIPPPKKRGRKTKKELARMAELEETE